MRLYDGDIIQSTYPRWKRYTINLPELSPLEVIRVRWMQITNGHSSQWAIRNG